MTTRSRVGRMLAAAATLVVGALLVTGCSDDPLADQYKAGSNKGYVAGDGSVKEIAPEDRGDPVDFSGTTETGEDFSSDDVAGEVTVVNFWYASCAPCRAEAPILGKVYDTYADDDGVSFIGVNLRDQAGTAVSFNKTYDVAYPSLIDVNSGSAKLAFAESVPPNSVPTTIVLDKEGRVAARILGPIESTSILDTLVGDALSESES